MRVGIYNEPSGGALGGGESSVAWVANVARALGHSVEVVHHQAWLRVADLEAFSGASLEGVSLRYVPARPEFYASSWLPWRRLAEARREGAEVSAGYDVFFCFVHGVPPFNHSQRGLLSILFPFVNMVNSGLPSAPFSLRERARALYARLEWARRLASYETPTAISRYSAEWSRTRWGVNPTIMYPPVEVKLAAGPRTPSIVTVGRFTRQGHPKRQDALLEAFQRLHLSGPTVLSLRMLGSLSAHPDDRLYYSELQSAALGLAVCLEPNATRAAIVEALAAGMVYWHAAGFGETADDHPERMEHFGIATVEAMAAGCVPIVINRGGQPEIVEHGVSGFVWETLDELIAYTRRLLDDPALREKMSAAARRRAQAFSIERFSREVRALLASPRNSVTDGLSYPSKVSS